MDKFSGRSLALYNELVCLPVVPPLSAPSFLWGSVLGVQAHREHGFETLDPVKFYLESQSYTKGTFWMRVNEVYNGDLHVLEA